MRVHRHGSIPCIVAKIIAIYQQHGPGMNRVDCCCLVLSHPVRFCLVICTRIIPPRSWTPSLPPTAERVTIDLLLLQMTKLTVNSCRTYPHLSGATVGVDKIFSSSQPWVHFNEKQLGPNVQPQTTSSLEFTATVKPIISCTTGRDIPGLGLH